MKLKVKFADDSLFIYDDLSKFKESLLNEEASKIGKNILLDVTHLD